MTASHFRVAVGWLPIVVIVAAGAWLLLTDHARRRADSVPAHFIWRPPSRTRAPPRVTVGLAKDRSFDPATAEAITPEQPAPVDGLKISSQSWHRGGLGSNAFVTMTLRNTNDYAVRDIEISCAFARPDGSHLTDRTRLIHDTVNIEEPENLYPDACRLRQRQCQQSKVLAARGQPHLDRGNFAKAA